MKFIGIIPARYASTRFPGKPLADMKGKYMIQRVYEQARKVLDHVCVATDGHRPHLQRRTVVRRRGGDDLGPAPQRHRPLLRGLPHAGRSRRCSHQHPGRRALHQTRADREPHRLLRLAPNPDCHPRAALRGVRGVRSAGQPQLAQSGAERAARGPLLQPLGYPLPARCGTGRMAGPPHLLQTHRHVWLPGRRAGPNWPHRSSCRAGCKTATPSR